MLKQKLSFSNVIVDLNKRIGDLKTTASHHAISEQGKEFLEFLLQKRSRDSKFNMKNFCGRNPLFEIA
ncbi:MAG: hypothetical protein HRK26_03875 [Rickettsiaceae bacterium H1]|nr:hypothetical protein [Rickettsiaceae bacterium H1]